jgi:DNA polymerase/3'-5' exonuclease PolX
MNTISDHPERWPLSSAAPIAKEICDALRPASERLAIAGSVRRQRLHVGDIEILFIPAFELRRTGLFEERADVAELKISELLEAGVLEKRTLAGGKTAWGASNKLGRHKQSGIPVDLFRATNENWWNYLVCRTGPVTSNTRIALAAIQRGWKWNPYGPGFSRQENGNTLFHPVKSEDEVFEFVGLPCLPPPRR